MRSKPSKEKKPSLPNQVEQHEVVIERYRDGGLRGVGFDSLVELREEESTGQEEEGEKLLESSTGITTRLGGKDEPRRRVRMGTSTASSTFKAGD